MNGGSGHGPRGSGRSGLRGAAGQRGPARPGAGRTPAGEVRKPRGSFPAAGAAQERGARGTAAEPPDAERLTRLLEPVVHAIGLDLESVRVTAAGRRRLLRVVVDADGGVTLDEIALASRELSARLDRGTEMGELPYTLEVSSPGVDRPLTQPRHWRRAVGRLVVVPLTGPGRNEVGTVAGRIAAATDAGVTLDCDGESRRYRFSELGAGRVQVEFGPGPSGEDDVGQDEEAEGGH